MGNTDIWLASIGITRDGDMYVYDHNCPDVTEWVTSDGRKWSADGFALRSKTSCHSTSDSANMGQTATRREQTE